MSAAVLGRMRRIYCDDVSSSIVWDGKVFLGRWAELGWADDGDDALPQLEA